MRFLLTNILGFLALPFLFSQSPSLGDEVPRVLDAGLHHLRVEGPREWSEFPETPEAERLELAFDATPNEQPWTLRLRQQDVKQLWHVRLNGQTLGELHRDENDMIVYFPVAAGTLAAGDNTLIVEQDTGRPTSPDDVRVGEITLDPRPLDEVLSEATAEILVIDRDTEAPAPARITVVNESGALHTVHAPPDLQLAVRPGTVFTANGRARFGLPAGKYTIYAGRGFEYSMASVTLTIRAGESANQTLTIRREVPTEGYVACDTHVHSLTHSGHGDATVQERMVTIAAEGIELPIATDHNVQIDHDPFAREVGVREHFTPVIGNEVTTRVGHFNIFPVAKAADVPDHRLTDWGEIFAEIQRATDASIIVLNHARDLHYGVRPFGPKHFNSAVAENLDGWTYGFNAMEVINSGATQTDVMQLFEDWMSLLNRGVHVTPIGSSDSHDVARHFVGQGRTYIRCDDRDPGNIDVAEAVESLQQGRVMVSYGLLAQLNVEGHGSGEVVSVDGGTVRVNVRVLGPHWVRAERVVLFANGRRIREQEITNDSPDDQDSDDERRGVKWSGEWTLPAPGHDVHLVAIARGPGIDAPYWRTAKPYQPTSPSWEPQAIGCSGAVWLDADGDGTKTAAREYADRIWTAAEGDLTRLLESLAEYDAAVAAHAADLYHDAGGSVTDAEFRSALQSAAPLVQAGFRDYVESWRENQTARATLSE